MWEQIWTVLPPLVGVYLVLSSRGMLVFCLEPIILDVVGWEGILATLVSFALG